jgi:hypothetical protein
VVQCGKGGGSNRDPHPHRKIIHKYLLPKEDEVVVSLVPDMHCLFLEFLLDKISINYVCRV